MTENWNQICTNFSPIKLNKITGRNIILSKDNYEAKRTPFGCYHGYIFSSDPIQIDQQYSIHIKVDNAITKYSILNIDRLIFGFTSCNPIYIKQSKLPIETKLLRGAIGSWTFDDLYKFCPLSSATIETGLKLSTSSSSSSSSPSSSSSSSSSRSTTTNNISTKNNNFEYYEYSFYISRSGNVYVKSYNDNKNTVIASLPTYYKQKFWIFMDISDPQQIISLGKKNNLLKLSARKLFGFIADNQPSTSSNSSTSSTGNNGYSSNTLTEDMKEFCLICNKYVVKILTIDGMNICYDCYQQQDTGVRRFKRNISMERRSSEPTNAVSGFQSFAPLRFHEHSNDSPHYSDDEYLKLQPSTSITSLLTIPTTKIPAEKLCIICLDAEKTHAILPCGHFSFCLPCCSSIIDKCPVCNMEKKGSLKIFI